MVQHTGKWILSALFGSGFSMFLLTAQSLSSQTLTTTRLAGAPLAAQADLSLKPLEGSIVVLSFDDATESQYSVVAPILKKYGFGATFYICEYPGFENKTQYMTWEQIKKLSDMGFEIGNHGRTHKHVTRMSREEMNQELQYIEDKCVSMGIPIPTTYAYPGYEMNQMSFDVLKERSYGYARTGGERPFVPGTDKAFELPSYTIKGEGDSTFNHLKEVLTDARNGQIVIICMHGVPDLAHDWVSTSKEVFGQMAQYLYDNKFTVIALRDIARYASK